MSKKSILAFVVVLAGTLAGALPAAAQCYADYRAQKTGPVQLHYGVAELPASACGNAGAAAQVLRGRLQRDGWTLVDILSTFGPDGLASRRDRAGQYYLRY